MGMRKKKKKKVQEGKGVGYHILMEGCCSPDEVLGDTFDVEGPS